MMIIDMMMIFVFIQLIFIIYYYIIIYFIFHLRSSGDPCGIIKLYINILFKLKIN